MSFSIEIIRDKDAIPLIAESWEKLYSRSENANIFLSYTWISSWSQYNKEIQPFIILIKDSNNKLIGLAPLGIKIGLRFNLKTKILQFLADGPSDYQDFLISHDNPAVIDKIITTIIKNKECWDVVELKEFSITSPNKDLILRNTIQKFRMSPCAICPQIELNRSSDNFAPSVSNAIRKDVNYQLRRLEKLGKVCFIRIEHENQIEHFLNSFFELHKKRWNSTKTKSSFNSIRLQEHFTGLAKRLFENGLAAFSCLEFEGRIVACQIGFKSKERFYYWMPAYDNDMGKYSIGKVFLYLLIKSEAEGGICTFDFLHGTENYKAAWGAIDYPNYQFSLVKFTLKGFLSTGLLYYNNNRKLFPFRVYRKIKKMIA
jgi:CelD/BcsL family acetyltransferase involved in cellulose biosynthesis